MPYHTNGLPKDLHQCAHPPNPPLNFATPPLPLSSATFHSRLKVKLFKLSYPDSTSTPRHAHHHRNLDLTFTDFDLETKQEAWWTLFNIAPLFELVSLASLLWVLRSFQRFTLHYIIVTGSSSTGPCASYWSEERSACAASYDGELC